MIHKYVDGISCRFERHGLGDILTAVFSIPVSAEETGLQLKD
tara:strand:+ start:319 stop:444 length:126 start_codon:yes stop_codon:yes gene_type:complete